MGKLLSVSSLLLVLLCGCGQGYWLGVYEGEIKKGTAAIASASTDRERAAGYDQRARGYGEKAYYLMAFEKIDREGGLRLFDQALRDHAEALRLDVGNADRYAGRGVTYVARASAGSPRKPQPKAETEKYQELAKADFSEAIRLDPRHEIALDRRGMIYEGQRDYEAALRDYTAEMAVNERAGKVRLAEAYCHRGGYLMGEKKFDLAIADYQRSIAFDVPTDGCSCEPYGALPWAYYELGRYDESWAAVRQAQAKRRWLSPEFLERLKKASGRDK